MQVEGSRAILQSCMYTLTCTYTCPKRELIHSYNVVLSGTEIGYVLASSSALLVMTVTIHEMWHSYDD